LIALALVPAAALVGMELAAGQLVTALDALRRVGLDMLLVVALGGGVLFIKQRVIHHNRHPPAITGLGPRSLYGLRH
jgi:hypothetical protein